MKALTMASFNISNALLERLADIARYMQVPVDALVEFALERELRRKEIQRVKDEISIEEIRLHILREGESVEPVLTEEAAMDMHAHNCDLCGTFFFQNLPRVDGPVFCDSCLKLAKGGEFELIEQELDEAKLDASLLGKG